MWLIFIGVGLLLFGAYIYLSKQPKPQTPQPPTFKYLVYSLAVVLIVIAAYLFYSVGSASGWDAFARFVFAIVMFVGGVKCIGAARDADQKYALDMGSRAEAKAYEHSREEHTIRLENARIEALRNEQLAAARRGTELIRLELERRNALLEMNLANTAQQKGVDTKALIDINTHYWKSEVDLAKRAKEYAQNQDTIDAVEHSQIRLIDLQTQRLFKMYEERKALEASKDIAKEDKLRQLNQNISVAEDLLRDEQNRLIQAAPGTVGRRSLSN